MSSNKYEIKTISTPLINHYVVAMCKQSQW